MRPFGRTAATALLLFGLWPAVRCHAELYRTKDGTGRVVVTNVKAGGERLRGGVLSVTGGEGGASPPLRLVAPARIGSARARVFREHVQAAAARYLLPVRLLEAVIAVESDFNPRALSAKGAQGLMQLLPGTARDMDVADPFDPADNIDGGARYLRQMLDLFRQDLTLALAAYNAGPNAVEAANGVPDYAETVDYVRRVKALYHGGMLTNTRGGLRSSRGKDGRIFITNIGH